MKKTRLYFVFSWFLDLPRQGKRLISLFLDTIMLFSACWAAFILRFGEAYEVIGEFWLAFVLAPVCIVPIMIPMGLYRAVIRYVGYRALWTVVKAVSLGILIWSFVVTVAGLDIPSAAMIIFWMAALVSVGGSRLLGRWMFRQLTPVGRSYKNLHASRALVYGAGASGQQIASAFWLSPEVSPIGFIDDDPAIQGSEIGGLRVYALSDIEHLIRQYDVDTVLLAIRSIPVARKRELVHHLEQFPVTVKVMPTLGDVATGKLHFSNIPNLDVTDLLGRDSVSPDRELLAECIETKSVMVTGAGGSIGSELCRQVILQKPTTLVLFELSEFSLYKIESELRSRISDLSIDVCLIPILGNVQDQQHVESVMRRFAVDTVYHAAAYKHVPIVEHNSLSGIKNNIFGTLSAAEAAVECGVQKFVLVSTDKAVRPTNVMGATKRLSELVLQAISAREKALSTTTEFAMVRFGNVLGSSGSVIPLFRKQIAQGGPITVTHPEITRYFMTIPEAASLVVQAGSIGHSGDVFLLDMGKSVKIVDLAKEMIRLAGYSVKDESNPTGDIEIVYTGLRPGEKLYEELLISGDIQGTQHPMIMRSSEDFIDWKELHGHLLQLESKIEKYDYDGIRSALLCLVSGYNPQTGIKDFLFEKEQLEFEKS